MRRNRWKMIAGMLAVILMAGCGEKPETALKETMAADVSETGDSENGGFQTTGTEETGVHPGTGSSAPDGNGGSRPSEPIELTPEETDNDILALQAAEKKLFEGKGLEEIEVATVEEFVALVDNGSINNKRIVLTGESYDFTEGDGINLKNVSNVEIIGSGSTRITADTGYDMVLTIYDSENILFYGVTMTHNRDDNNKSMECGLVLTYNMSELWFVNCELTGGYLAYSLGDTTLTCINTGLTDCIWQAVVSMNSTLNFQNCVMDGNGFNNEFMNPLVNAAGSTVNISNTMISNNTAPSVCPDSNCVWNENNVTYQGNSWQE